jgi:hypothetical protein
MEFWNSGPCKLCYGYMFLAFTFSFPSCIWQSGAAKETPPDKLCERNLRHIANALRQYKKDHQCLPSAVCTDRCGNRFSWRVAIAPFVLTTCLPVEDATRKLKALKKYQYGKAWNSQENMQWSLENAGGCIFGYQCTTEIECDNNIGLPINDSYTSYLMLDYSNYYKNAHRAAGDSSLRDNAVVVVESVGSGIFWHQPRDIDVKSLFNDGSMFGLRKLNSLHPKVVKAIRADGEVIDIPKDITKEDLRKLLLGNVSLKQR